MKKDNPFTLMFGKLPHTLVNRNENLSTIIGCFTGTNPLSQTFLISGVRGSGKTVLMTSVEKQLLELADWIVVDLNVNMDLLEDLANRLVDACRRIPNFLDKGFDISAFGIGIGVGGNENTRDNVSQIEKILEYAKRKNKKVLIAIDEVSNSNNMRIFASQFQILVRKDLPVYLIMTGLYENIYQIQNDPSLTFLLRSPKLNLEPLNLRQITNQYKKLLNIDCERAKEFALLTKGYAFAFQAFGMVYFENADTLMMDEIIEKFEDLLDEFVYSKIWSSLSEKEREIVKVIPGDAEIKVSEICNLLGINSSNFSQYRERLIRKGIIESSKYGYIELSLPRFRQIIETY